MEKIQRGDTTMGNDTVVSLKKPVVIDDLLTETLRAGARQLLAAAIEAEVAEFLEAHNGTGEKARFVRNGYLLEREIQTGIGQVAVKVPRVRDRSKSSDGIGYVSNLVPKYLRRSKSLNDFLPLLYLKGISTNDFVEVLKPLIGSEGKNLSPGVISRLKASWEQEYTAWRKREMSGKHYVYFWVDGIYLQVRMEESKACVLVIIGVDERGQKDLIAMEAGYRESKESWLTLLRDLKSRGLHQAPKLAAGDGALGFWGALNEIYPDTRHQRCWFHKMDNILDKLPKSLLSKAKQQLQAIWI
ncbi:TPA: IS256 family transposase [Legionella pneumophila subsp. pneumophila]|nr:IS256 family transposase [Legionella pneumophila subsp. pneumophila]